MAPGTTLPSAGTLLVTHTAAGGDSDLDSVSARLADMLQVERLVGGLVVTTLDGEWRGVDAHLHGGRPVGVHLPVLVVVALELQLQVRPGGRQGMGRGVCLHASHCTACHHTVLLQATQKHAVLSRCMLQCVTRHCDKPQRYQIIALCQATPRPTMLCPKPPCCATTCRTP